MADTLETYAPTPAQHTALWQIVVAALRRSIILGELPPGLHLEETALAEKFGVSRIPIREALARLAHEGLVRVEPRRGAFVIGTTERDVHEIYELRRLIEIYALRLTVERIDAAGLARLQHFADQMAEAVESQNHDRVAEPDVRFHRELVVLADQRRILSAWEPIGGLIRTILGITNTTHRNMPASVGSHQRMIRLLKEGSADLAEQELRGHLEHGEQVMIDAMRMVRTRVGEVST